MIEERTIELINGDLDGELSEADRLELDDCLAQSEEARRYQNSMSKLNVFLEELPAQPIPDALHGDIVRQIKLSDRSAFSTLTKITDWKGFIRFGLATAAGLLLAVGIYQFGSKTAPTDLDRMVGAITPEASNAVVLGTFAVDIDELSSSVSLERRADAIVLKIDLDSALPVDLRIDFSGSGLQLDTDSQIQSDLKYFEVTDEAIHSSGPGRKSFVVSLRRSNDMTSHKNNAIRIEYSSNGSLIQQGTLMPRW